MHIVHAAAENDALAGAKVGGMGDVVRDIAPALADRGHTATVITPSYGFLHLAEGAERLGKVEFPFRGARHTAEAFAVPAGIPRSGVRHCVIDHPWLAAHDPVTGAHRIYVNDPPHRPFHTDASRFALFCAAAGAALCRGPLERPDVLHLHDWHAAFLALLRRRHPFYAALQSVPAVFTIHNIAMQGVRPFQGSASSLAAWFPEISGVQPDVADPRWPDCVNMAACGILLSDRVHAVSPTYAEELCRPGDPPHSYGAEGLENALNSVRKAGRLVGVLNGCPYPADRRPPVMSFDRLIRELQRQVMQWAARRQTLQTAHFIAFHALADLAGKTAAGRISLFSVFRLTDQKTLLMQQPGADGTPALERILTELGDAGQYFLLGAGDPRLEAFFTRMSARFPNFIFLNGYSDACAEMLYANGDLFLMPSAFEPCGVGQMLALRDGAPCVVHTVGGLRDTVRDGVNGFRFGGRDVAEQADRFAETTARAVRLFRRRPRQWTEMKREAAAARFTWEDAADAYVEKLYAS